MRALVLGDDQELARLLSEEGLMVDVCAGALDAVAQVEGGHYDLVVIDSVSSPTDDLALCREIRRVGNHAAILMLTTAAEPRRCVRGLEAGADTCLVKPFDVAEFVARVRALLRRAASFVPGHCGELEIDRVTRQAKLAGVRLALTDCEYRLLLYLLDRPDQVVKRSDLLIHVLDTGLDANSNIVDFHVSRLRDKLGLRAWMVETVRGVGYRLRGQRDS